MSNKIDKYKTMFIGKPNKKTKTQEELENISSSVPESWQDALENLKQSINYKFDQLAISGLVQGNALNWNSTLQASPDAPSYAQMSPIQPWYSSGGAVPSTAGLANFDLDMAKQLLNQPKNRLFNPSSNGVFFPC